MFLIELWNEYLSKTMPVLTAGGIPLVVIQMLGGLPPLAGLYRSVRRDSMAERVMLCLVPGIFVVSVAIVEPLFFDSFLGDGFPWTQALLKFLNQPRFFEEALVLAWAFLMAAAATWMAQRWDGQFYIRSYLLSIGSGLLVSSVVMILSIDHFLLGGVLFSVLGGQVVKWLVYGIYLLLYQLFVLLVCLLWRLLFSERGSVGDGNYKRWLRRYLARGYRAYGWSALMFAALWAFSIVYGLYREGSPYGWALVVNVVLVVIGVVCLVRSFLQPDYRRILSWGDPEETLCQLHHELVDKEPLVKADIGFLTEHYMVTAAPKRIFCRALLERPPKLDVMGAYVLQFQDGGRCRINRCYQQLLEPLLKSNHGDASVALIRTKGIRLKGIRLSAKDHRIAELIIRFHCRDDQAGFDAIQAAPDLSKKDRERACHLYCICKDMDGLDRVRFNGLDYRMLRTEYGRRLPLVAGCLLEESLLEALQYGLGKGTM